MDKVKCPQLDSFSCRECNFSNLSGGTCSQVPYTIGMLCKHACVLSSHAMRVHISQLYKYGPRINNDITSGYGSPSFKVPASDHNIIWWYSYSIHPPES